MNYFCKSRNLYESLDKTGTSQSDFTNSSHSQAFFILFLIQQTDSQTFATSHLRIRSCIIFGPLVFVL